MIKPVSGSSPIELIKDMIPLMVAPIIVLNFYKMDVILLKGSIKLLPHFFLVDDIFNKQKILILIE